MKRKALPLPSVVHLPDALLTPSDIAGQLALDEALGEWVDREVSAREVIRFWEPDHVAVIVGRSSRLSAEVDEAQCRRDAVPIYRRGSGGAAVLVGPGCLLCAVVLSTARRPALRRIDRAHRYILARHAQAVSAAAGIPIACAGTSDLVWGDRKVSGNSMRWRCRSVLYHGTWLYDFPIELLGRYLKPPPRQPDYRRGRAHEAFVANLPLGREAIMDALCRAWQAEATEISLPWAAVEHYRRVRYDEEVWHREGRTMRSVR